MLSKVEQKTIVQCAKKYKVSSIFLFGSAVDEGREANDIDLGVKGLQPRLFFKFYAELIRRLPKRVDVVDLTQKSLFNELVEETGIKIYG